MTGAPLDLEALEHFDDATLAELRERLATCEFDASFVGRAEAIAPGQLDQVRLPAVRSWLRREGSPAAVLARLFAYRDRVSFEELTSAVPVRIADALLAAGVLVASGPDLSSRLRLMPFEGTWVASDEMDAAGDPVMGPGATTQQLARTMAVRPGDVVLDVGCGAGSLALAAAARGAVDVVGVDLMDRAVAWSRFNARLNGLHATFLAGDLVTPVADRRFDLVVSQPPYVIRADATETTTYLHGGRRGDEIALRLLREAPRVLAPGGRLLVLFDSPVIPGRPVEQVVRVALDGSGLQAFAVIAPGHSADVQAIAYSSVRNPALDAGYEASVLATLEHLHTLGIERSVHVLVFARRASEGETPLAVVLETDRATRWDARAVDGLQRGAALAASSDEALLSSAIAVSPHAWLVQEQALGPRRGHRLRVRFEDDRTPDFELSDGAAVLVEAAMQARVVRDVVKHYARAARAKPAAVQVRVLEFVRGALVSGLLIAG